MLLWEEDIVTVLLSSQMHVTLTRRCDYSPSHLPKVCYFDKRMWSQPFSLHKGMLLWQEDLVLSLLTSERYVTMTRGCGHNHSTYRWHFISTKCPKHTLLGVDGQKCSLHTLSTFCYNFHSKLSIWIMCVHFLFVGDEGQKSVCFAHSFKCW